MKPSCWSENFICIIGGIACFSAGNSWIGYALPELPVNWRLLIACTFWATGVCLAFLPVNLIILRYRLHRLRTRAAPVESLRRLRTVVDELTNQIKK